MANYPPLLDLDEDVARELKMYLESELVNHDAERGQFVDDLINYQKDYWAKPTSETRNFPFKGAANIVIPLTAIVFETVHARVMQQAFGLPQIAAGKAINPDWEPATDPFMRYLNHELIHSVNFKKKAEPSIIEIEKLGTGVGYSCYENLIKYGRRTVNGVEQDFPVTIKNGPSVYSVPVSRLIFPFSAQDVENSPWIGEEHTNTPYYIQILEQSEFVYPGTYEALKFYFTNVNTLEGGMKYQESQERLENRQPSPFANRIDWVEWWGAFAIKPGSTKLYEIVVHYHRQTRMLMAVRHNWHDDLRRKYRIGIYFPIEHRIYGIGIAKQNEQFQREVTTQHRQRLDNATLANMRMIKVSKMSGYGPNEPVFPGKMWFLDDLAQVETFQLGEIYPSAYNNEQQTLMYSQQRTGVNEVTLGMPQVGTPGTATSDLARIQEGKAKFDYTYGNIKAFCDSLILDVACDIHQFGPSSIEFFENIEGGQLAAQVLELPESVLRKGLIIELSAAGAKENRVLDRTKWQEIIQALQMYYNGLFQMAQSNPQLMPLIATKGLAGATEAMKQYLETHDIRNINKIIVPELLNNGIAAPASSPGGNTGAAQAAIPGAMGNPAEILKLLAGGGQQ